MNKFKKILIGLITAAGISCLCGAAACTGGSAPKFYELKFEGKGLDYIMLGSLAETDEDGNQFISGGTVKDGVEVRFSITLAANSTGAPVISANGETLTPDENNEYSFIMKSDTVVSVSGLGSIYDLKLCRTEQVPDANGNNYEEERWISYLDENGNGFGSDVLVEDVVKVESGTPFKFKLQVSPYYTPQYTVSCGFDVLEPDANGVYTINNLTQNSEVRVTGLEQAPSFVTGRKDCGSGTASDPYLLSQPIDMFYFAVLINSPTLSSYYATAHYKLVEDIDMQGEHLYVIGDGSNDAMFCGTFDGNNKTIRNFYITDEVVDQESYEEAYLPYVGLFGQAVATVNAPVVIKNLTLEDYVVKAHPGAAGAGAYVGSLVGYGIGVQITGCRAVGEVVVTNDDNQIVNMGGLVGRMQAAYRADSRATITWDAFVTASSTDVELSGNGTPHSAGGIVGYLSAADISAIAYVSNSCSSGRTSGAMRTGGIVGTMGRFASVSNCYSVSQVSSNNSINIPNLTEQFKGSYAGGIVGYAEEDTVIAGCYAANASLTAYCVRNDERYKKTGDFAAYYDKAGTSSIESSAVLLINNSQAVENHPNEVFLGLGWQQSEWNFDGKLPRPVVSSAERTVKVTVKDGAKTVETVTKNIVDARPFYTWFEDGVLSEYITASGKRSGGYFFDEALTQRVPYGYILTNSEVTLYVGFADYGEVEGAYYIRPTEYSKGAYIELTADGTAKLRNGGMYFECVYAYDGEKITLYNTNLVSLLHDTEAVDGRYFNLVGTINDGLFEINGIAMLLQVDGENASYVNTKIELAASKEIEGFGYGEYRAANGMTYMFDKDGTGWFKTGTRTTEFTYKQAGESWAIAPAGGGTIPMTVVGGQVTAISGTAVTLKDGFTGVWSKSANSQVTFSFDGLGGVTYVNGGATVTGTYQVTDGEAEISVDGKTLKAAFSNGTLVIDGEVYYVNDGFTGEWYMSAQNESIELLLEGIGTDGYGHAVISYTGGQVVSLDAQYDVFADGDVKIMRIYVEDQQYGELEYNAATKTASGVFYSVLESKYYASAKFYLYDNFKGVWVSNTEDIDTASFNGKSADGTGEVMIRSASGKTSRVNYSLSNATSGTMTVGEKAYAISFDEFTGRVTLTLTGETISTEELAERDGWYGVVLYDGETSYTFDGKGYIGGTVTVSDGTTLSYTVSEGRVTVDGKELTAEADGFGYNGKKLVFKTGFANSWLVSGTDKVLTIKEVNSSFKAEVSCTGVEGAFEFVYSPADKTLTLTEILSNGERIITTVKLMGTTGSDEMNITRSGADGVNVRYNCLVSGKEDEWRGTYTAKDGSSWTFDGLGLCKYGKGTATFTTADGDKIKYNYTVDELGTPYIGVRQDGDMEKLNVLFLPAGSGESGFEKDGVAYKTASPDYYYGRKVYVLDDDKNRTWYYFDGFGKLWVQNETGYSVAYDYKIVSNTVVELTSKADGKVYDGSLRETGLYIKLTIKAREQA